ncbi:DUF1648 domain-containing protein [Arthrobacter sp. zg-Y1171]|uniref:DUF1648 domain-containing protein n=1 Tax=Arthrobacter sp. zg-Y1171 TaxID=2964610 RepID=UPI002104DFBD|nr:DUF1648 domain-containing protein [Arthrobacter sp. zg-Y1171]MCQ1995124.1 DUF1648 domain-containing protein [Arthrobacter sp. zg-Y1171]UWX80829.1 DUF1648 domain-containing protein [Arthrobacter sp. zg-Y1171]
MDSKVETKITSGRGIFWLIHFAAVLVSLSCFAYGTTIYDSLPETIPTHWGAGGSPDEWEAKSFGTVFFPLMMGGGLSVLLALIAAVVPAMVPPETDSSDWELYRREGTIRGTVAALGWTSFLIAVLIGTLTVAGWRTPDHVPAGPALVMVALILGCLVLCYAAGARWARRTAERDGVRPTAEEQEEEKRWVGGILYNDPNDPHVLVPKRSGSGTGLTVNVGNRAGRTAVVVFLVVFVVLPAGFGVFQAL